MIKKQSPFRIKMFLWHIAFSVVLTCICLYLIFKVWYIPPLHIILDVSNVVLLMLGIGVILGPLLTLIVANPAKKEVKRDLLIIVLIQLIALGYGLFSISQNRPAWLVFYEDSFELVQAGVAVREDNENILPKYQYDSWFYPKWVAVRSPQSKDEAQRWIVDGYEERISPAMRPKLYEPIEEAFDRINQKKFPIKNLAQYNDKDKVQQILNKYPKADGYLALWSIGPLATVLIDGENKEVLGIVDLKPW